MRKGTRRVGVLLIALGFVLASAVSASAISVSSPAPPYPFVVPGDASGNPMFFDVSVSGLAQNEPAYIQICDGTPSTTQGYSVNEHCDLTTGNSPVNGDVSGNATFHGDQSGERVNIFKGLSPQGFFYCLSPNDPAPQIPPNPNVPIWRNCQIRVSGGVPGDTTEQQFFTIQLPDTPPPPPPNPACGMGAGTPVAGKPNKNTGLVKISNGLLPAAALKDTKWKLQGSVDACTNFPNAPKTGTPIISGSMKLGVEMPPGANCANEVVGAPVKGSWQVKWNAMSGTAVKAGVAKDGGKILATFTGGGDEPLTVDATTPAIVDPKSLFIGKHISFHFVMDENQAARDLACNDPKLKGIAVLHFTGPASQITVLP
jgi:hypothetical protein